jgi:Reverse transcriptase (RNA-dependent DNA polymerase)
MSPVVTPMSPPREPPPRESSPREPPTAPVPPEPDSAPAPAPALAPALRHTSRSTAGQCQTQCYHAKFHLNGLIVQWPETAEELDTPIQALVASKSDPDVLTYDQAVRDVDVEGWCEAMNKEIMSLVAQGTLEVVPRSEATAAQKRIPGTWVLRRKRKPDSSISKLKARWCVRSNLQESQHYTFAPVVCWETIHMLLYFSLFFGLKTKSIDFSNAFVQATLNDPTYIHLQCGFRHKGSDVCCNLKKSLCIITQAPRLWFEHLRDKLLASGFRQSCYNPCLFYSKEVYLVVYFDNVILD